MKVAQLTSLSIGDDNSIGQVKAKTMNIARHNGGMGKSHW